MKSAARHIYTMRARADSVAATRERIARAMLTLALAQLYEEITLAALAQASKVSQSSDRRSAGVRIAVCRFAARSLRLPEQ
jgi:hypothetical protein